MFQITQIGVNLDVLISLVIAVEITNDGKIGGVGDPQVVTVPCQSLDGVESGGELFGRIRLAVAIGIEKQHDAIARSVRFRIAILRPHADEQSSPLVKRHRARLPDQWFAGKQRDFELRWDFGQRLQIRRLVFELGPGQRRVSQMD